MQVSLFSNPVEQNRLKIIQADAEKEALMRDVQAAKIEEQKKKEARLNKDIHHQSDILDQIEQLEEKKRLEVQRLEMENIASKQAEEDFERLLEQEKRRILQGHSTRRAFVPHFGPK